MSELIKDVDILDEAKDNFLTYSEEVLVDRAVPSAEDGLLSVHRKLLWTMAEILKMDSRSKFKKCASIVGSTLASSYYHGDQACYGALCKITQPYLMRYPLIEGDGNLGTQEGNGMEASQRYSNARPSIYADLMMTDFNKNVVPLKETYNGEYYEPVVLPSIFPNALVNGRETIAIGLAHCSNPNNLTEVCDALLYRFKVNRELTIDEVMNYIKGPDFPLENVVINKNDIKEAFATGKSKVSLKVRGKYKIEKNKIIFTTIPYRTYRNKIREQLSKNVDILENYIDDFSDESNVGENRLIFEVKKGVAPEAAVAKLFALTDLQTTISYNMNYIVNGTPKLCSISDLVESYVIHQNNIAIKGAEFDKDKAERRKHILEGLLVAVEDIDRAIKLIRASDNKEIAKTSLMAAFEITEAQSRAILDMKLSRLTKLDRDELLNELKSKVAIIAECNKIITDNSYRAIIISKKIQELKNKYGDARRTELLQLDEKKDIEQIEKKECLVDISTDNRIKMTTEIAKVQRRGGLGTKNTSNTVKAIKTNTADSLLVFTSVGKVYQLGVSKIPELKAVDISSLISIPSGETIINISTKGEGKYISFLTKKGLYKRTPVEEYSSIKRASGLIALKVLPNDTLVSVDYTNDEPYLVVTKKGMSLCFDSSTVVETGRVSAGVKTIKLDEDDEVVSGVPVTNEVNELAIFYENGHGRKIKVEEFPIQGRGGKGLIVAKQNIKAAIGVNNNDNLMLVGEKNKINISAQAIPLTKRTPSQGVILTKDSNLVSVTKI